MTKIKKPRLAKIKNYFPDLKTENTKGEVLVLQNIIPNKNERKVKGVVKELRQYFSSVNIRRNKKFVGVYRSLKPSKRKVNIIGATQENVEKLSALDEEAIQIARVKAEFDIILKDISSNNVKINKDFDNVYKIIKNLISFKNALPNVINKLKTKVKEETKRKDLEELIDTIIVDEIKERILTISNNITKWLKILNEQNTELRNFNF